MNVKIWYLYNSGFAVQTERHFLIFDYWKSTPKGGGLDDGVINPSALKDQDVLVFASHRHGDHYNPEILGWKSDIPKMRIILSDDIQAVPDAIMIGKNQRLTQSDFSLETFASTDEGVAFLVELDGLRIYHAGDLNWWHWEGESDDYNARMAKNYKERIDLLGTRQIDLAFAPVDPRLGEQSHWGIDYLMRAAQVRYVVPMHFRDDSSVVERLLGDPSSADYRERILPLTKRGQRVEIE